MSPDFLVLKRAKFKVAAVIVMELMLTLLWAIAPTLAGTGHRGRH